MTTYHDHTATHLWRIVGIGGLTYPDWEATRDKAEIAYSKKARAHPTLGLRLQVQTDFGWTNADEVHWLDEFNPADLGEQPDLFGDTVHT